MSSEPPPSDELASSPTDALPAASAQPAASEPTEEEEVVGQEVGGGASIGEGGTVAQNTEPAGDMPGEVMEAAPADPPAASPQPAAGEPTEEEDVVEKELGGAASIGEGGTVAQNTEPAGDMPGEVMEAAPSDPPAASPQPTTGESTEEEEVDGKELGGGASIGEGGTAAENTEPAGDVPRDVMEAAPADPPAASPQPAAGEPTEKEETVIEEGLGGAASIGEGGTVAENTEPAPTEGRAPSTADAPPATSTQPADGEITEEAQPVIEKELGGAAASIGDGVSVEENVKPADGELGDVMEAAPADPPHAEPTVQPARQSVEETRIFPQRTPQTEAAESQPARLSPSAARKDFPENVEPAGGVPGEVLEAAPADSPHEEPAVQPARQPVEETRIVPKLILQTEAPESRQLSPCAAQKYSPAPHPPTPRSSGATPVSPSRSRVSRQCSIKKLCLADVTFERTAPFFLGSPRSVSFHRPSRVDQMVYFRCSPRVDFTPNLGVLKL